MRELIHEFSTFLPITNRKYALPVETRVSKINFSIFITNNPKISILGFSNLTTFGTRNPYQLNVRNDLNFYVSQKFPSNCLYTVIDEIHDHLAHIWIKFPNDVEVQS